MAATAKRASAAEAAPSPIVERSDAAAAKRRSRVTSAPLSDMRASAAYRLQVAQPAAPLRLERRDAPLGATS
jgi:xanthine dehydrogenase iron-sulfur cluster and FAD-binding subunit A